MLFPSLSKEALDITVKVDDNALSSSNGGSSLVLVGAIDQGTSSTRFLVFTPQGEIAAWAQMEHTQVFPEGEDKVNKTSAVLQTTLLIQYLILLAGYLFRGSQ